MTDRNKTYITAQMLAEIGVEFNKRTSSPVSFSDIRKWGIAVYWPEQPPRLFWDEEFAKNTCYGGVIAPQDFNPFAWSVIQPAPRTETVNTPHAQGLNGGGRSFYHAPIRPGDIISSVSSIKEYREREGRLGLMLFTITQTRWTNQLGTLVKVYESVGIRY